MSKSDANTLVSRFWDDLHQNRTGMLGLVDDREAHSQPMTAFFEGSAGPLWFYTPHDSKLAKATAQHQRATFNYVGPDHKLYACVHGDLTLCKDQEVISRYWTHEVGSWFPNGRTDGSVAMLKFDPGEAQIWLPADYARLSIVRLGSGG